MTLANLNDQLMQLGVGQGTLRVTVYEMPQDNSVEIDTPNGALITAKRGLLSSGYRRRRQLHASHGECRHPANLPPETFQKPCKAGRLYS